MAGKSKLIENALEVAARAAGIIPGTFPGKKLPSVDALANTSDKFVYHSGLAEDVPSMKYGIDPQIGPWIKEVLNSATDEDDLLREIEENAVPVSWWSKDPSWAAVKVARKLEKPVSEVTPEELAQYGHVALIPKKDPEAEHMFWVGEEGLSNGPYSEVEDITGKKVKAYNTDLFSGNYGPEGVERNEYITPRSVEPYLHLTGDDLVSFLRKTGAYDKAGGGEVDPYADEAASAKAAMAEKQYSEQPWSEWAGDVVGNAVNTAKAILPTALGGEGRVGVTDIARGAYEGAKDAVTFPGDVLTGKQALYDESGRPLESAVGRSLNTVGAVGGVSSLVPVPSNSLRVFGGVKAKTADRNALTQAQIMEGKGASSEEIYNATGWSRGADEQWRFEIPDVGTTVDPDKFQFNLASTQTPADMITTVGEYLNHPKLLDAYPEFKTMPVRGYYGSGYTWGYYMPRQDNAGFISNPYIALNLNYLKDPSMQRKTLLHELQHAVQQKEGFMRGANKSMFAPDTVPNPKIRVYEEALINDPDMKEFQSISKSKEFQRQIDASNDLYKREWEDKFKALKEEEEKTGVDLTGEWFKLSEAYEKAAHEQFPLLKRRVQLAKSLHERGIPSSRPMKPFLTPEQAYEHTAGEVEARNVQYRLDTPEEELRKSYPASTEDIPRNQQLIDWNDTSWRRGYSVGGASDSDRDIESAMMTQVPRQKATAEWADPIMEYWEKNPIPWGYADGGEVDDDINDALRIAKDVGGTTGENPQVFLTDAKGRQYDAQGRPIAPANPATGQTTSAAVDSPNATNYERRGVLEVGEPEKYESDVKPLIDYAVTPIDRPGMAQNPKTPKPHLAMRILKMKEL